MQEDGFSQYAFKAGQIELSWNVWGRRSGGIEIEAKGRREVRCVRFSVEVRHAKAYTTKLRRAYCGVSSPFSESPFFRGDEEISSEKTY